MDEIEVEIQESVTEEDDALGRTLVTIGTVIVFGAVTVIAIRAIDLMRDMAIKKKVGVYLKKEKTWKQYLDEDLENQSKGK